MPDHQSSSDSTLSTSEHDATMESLDQPAVSRSSLWLDDGSVVLQAENTQFRVHRSMLSRHSQVFRDMFSVPQPMGSEDMVEGCPIVHLSDSVQDVTHLLSALYDQYATRQVLTFPVVAAMLRLGSKYDFHHLKEEALFRLRAEFPTTLEDWDKVLPGYTYFEEYDGMIFDIVNLAIEHGLFSILPVAYFVCTSDLKSILKGEIREDGSRAILVPVSQQACILGIQKIVEAQATTTLSWLDDEALINGCTASRQCDLHRSSLAIFVFKQSDPSFSLVAWDKIDKTSLCKACVKDAKQKHNAGRSKMWDMMPGNFGFLPWDELKKLDRY